MSRYTEDNRAILVLYVESMKAKLQVFLERGLPEDDYKACMDGLEEGYNRSLAAMDQCDDLENFDPLFDLHSSLVNNRDDNVLFDASRMSVVEYVLDMEILEYKFSEEDEPLEDDRQMFFSCYCTDLFLISSLITAVSKAQKQSENRVLH